MDKDELIKILQEADKIKQYTGGVDLYADGWSDAVDYIASMLGIDTE